MPFTCDQSNSEEKENNRRKSNRIIKVNYKEKGCTKPMHIPCKIIKEINYFAFLAKNFANPLPAIAYDSEIRTPVSKSNPPYTPP